MPNSNALVKPSGKILQTRIASLLLSVVCLSTNVYAEGWSLFGSGGKSDADNAAQATIKAAKAVEKMRAHLEEWGTVNVSQPLLYPVSGQFSLGAQTDFPTYKEYYISELTNVTGSVGQLGQMALGGSFSGTANSPQLTATPAGSGAQGAAPATATPTDPPASQSKAALDQPNFHKSGELLGLAPNGNSPHSATVQAATDKVAELLMRMLANPAPPADGSKLYLAIFQVTCNPGWRTLKGYMADVYVQWEYGRQRDGKLSLSLSDGSPTAPSIVAMLPLVDAQNMELRNGQRELYSMLTSLAASGALSGANVAGKGVLDYVNSYQKDAASRNAMPVVNSYSTGYGMGFRFAPSFVAISDPAKKKSQSANMLIPTSFPVLAVVRMREADVKKQRYDRLVVEENFRWLVRDRRVSLLPWDWELPRRREDEVRRTTVAEQSQEALTVLWEARKAYEAVSDSGSDFTARADYQRLRTDYHELANKLGPIWTESPIPDLVEHKPRILHCQPEVIDPSVDTKVTIQGENLQADGLRVFLGGQECTVVSVDNGKSIVALFKSGNLATRDNLIPSSGVPANGCGCGPVAKKDEKKPPQGEGSDNPLSTGDDVLGQHNPPSFVTATLPKPTGANPAAEAVTPVKTDLPAGGAVKKSYTDLVVATKTGADSKEVEVNLGKQSQQAADEKVKKQVKITRDSQGKIISIDFSGLGDNPSKDVLTVVGSILGADDKSTSEKPAPDKGGGS